MQKNGTWLRFSMAGLIVASIGILPACQKKKSGSAALAPASTIEKPKRVHLQTIVVAFKGSIAARKIERTAEKAKTLAQEVLTMSKSETDFSALVKKYSDEPSPHSFTIADHGVELKPLEFPRDQFPKAIGDLGFSMKVGEVLIAPYDKSYSPFGYTLIKRIE